MVDETSAPTPVGADDKLRSSHRRWSGEASGDIGGVRMTARKEVRLRHVSDTPPGGGAAFGGDTLGQWNVDRINRILDSMDAPVVQLPIDPITMRAMAKVGAPDMVQVGRYVARGLRTMPPLSFIAIDLGDGHKRTMMVDGHHRMMALAMLDAPTVPVRVLPAALADDVRIVEMYECAVFPALQWPTNEVEIGRSS